MSKIEHQKRLQSIDLFSNISVERLAEIIKNAFALNAMGQFEEAISWYDKALAINPEDVRTLYNKGIILHKLGRYEEAIFWYDEAISIDPTFIGALYNKKMAMEKIGKHYGVMMMTQKQFS